MEEQLSLPKKLFVLVRANLLISALFSLGLICLTIGLIQYFAPKPESIIFESQGEVKSAEAKVELTSLFVDVSGEVENPGLYEFKSEARVQDALDKAGGLSEGADFEYVSKNLNLASKLGDGMKIYIPKAGETDANLVTTSSGLSQDSNTANSIISINNASVTQLESLPGVGPVTANKIIASRPYSSLDELVSKKAIGQSLFAKIKDAISL